MNRSLPKESPAVLSLLDRLTELSSEEASNATIGRGELPMDDIEASILRDLGWLLNTTSLATTQDLSRWPNIRKSVLNFGVPVFAGRITSNADVTAIERALKKAIAVFEPRLQAESIAVEAVSDSSRMDQRSLQLNISADFVEWKHFAPIQFRAKIDLESGRIQLMD